MVSVHLLCSKKKMIFYQFFWPRFPKTINKSPSIPTLSSMTTIQLVPTFYDQQAMVSTKSIICCSIFTEPISWERKMVDTRIDFHEWDATKMIFLFVFIPTYEELGLTPIIGLTFCFSPCGQSWKWDVFLWENETNIFWGGSTK
jgi:hypothetical protein